MTTKPIFKFLVISYDRDEDQALMDWVLAKNTDHARKIVGDARESHAVVVEVFSVRGVLDLAKEARRLTQKDVKEAWATTLGWLKV